MNDQFEFREAGAQDPGSHPDVPDDPHPSDPEPERAPDTPNEPYPIEDPIAGNDPGVEPVREPNPGPSIPEPIPGGPPDVLV